MPLPYNPKIMVVADNPDMLRDIAGMFRNTGYTFNQAETGRQCLELIKSDRPDLVILDINLKDINRYEICRQIKTGAQTDNIYVIFVSAYKFGHEYQVKAFANGADGLLIHPFTEMELHSNLNPLIKLIKIEKENFEVLKQLEENENLFGALVENSFDIIAICRNKKVVRINQTGLRLLDVKPITGIEGKDITSFIFPGKPSDLPRQFENALETGSPCHTNEIFQAPDGNPLPLEIKIVPVIYDGLSSILLLGRNISEKFMDRQNPEKYMKELEEKVQLRLEEVREKSTKLEESQKALSYLLEDVNESRSELETANRNLQMLNKELEAFTYSVSHDLRAPIRAIDGFSRILLEEYVNHLDDEGKRLFGIIVKSASNMQRLIDDLLAFSRLGPKQPAMHKIDTGSLIANIIDELKAGNPARKITWKVSGLPEIYGDQGMLKQVFANIIGNSVKFTSKTKDAVIEIGGGYNAEKTRVWVKDNGAGFDMKYAPKVFEVFQRLHDSKEFEGTGIGMAIVKKILDKHNGEIIPESKPGIGSVFTVELPHL
jgi:signal transduction histidine kinase/FixJ family two-component response regulator